MSGDDIEAALAAFREGNALHEAQRFGESVAAFDRALAKLPDSPEAHFNRANALLAAGRAEEALRGFDRALACRPAFPEAHVNRGNALKALGRPEEALASYDAALAERPALFEAHINRGHALRALKRSDEAAASYRSAARLRPDFAPALVSLGAALREAGRAREAAEVLREALRRGADPVEAQTQLGLALQDLGDFDGALGAFTAAVDLKPSSTALANRAVLWLLRRRPLEALEDYETALRLAPLKAALHNGRGAALYPLGRRREALDAFDRALELDPNEPDAALNLALALLDHGHGPEGLARLERLAAQRPADARVRHALGKALQDAGQAEAGQAAITGAEALGGAEDFLAGHARHARMSVALWDDEAPRRAALAQAVLRGERAISPFSALSLADDPALQRAASEIWTRTEVSPAVSRRFALPRRDRIRLAYVSADFRAHAMASLMIDVFERRDRGRFELFAFAIGGRPDAMTERLRGVFDYFIDLSDMSDEAAAEAMREQEIDIAVDLMGYTTGSRPNLFALRAAPVQASYLGFPGTLGAGHIDYLIADAVVAPASAAEAFAERIVRLPGSYYPTSHRAMAASLPPTRRADWGLPEAAFVFCGFNSAYKLNPELFDAWMRILRAAPSAVLWLLGDKEAFRGRLRAEAERRGVEGARLIFAPRTGWLSHISRCALADLFLDAWPYNAHTTACDALWAGLPVLTKIGDAFAARVGASLLSAAGLPELIAGTVEVYEERALALYGDRVRLAALRRRLLAGKDKAPLFDASAKARALDAAFAAMHARRLAGLAPASFEVEVPSQAASQTWSRPSRLAR